MMPKSVQRFSDDIMLKQSRMMPKSVQRFSDDIMLKRLDPITLMISGDYSPKSS